jgi:DNA-binding XRE family transcriptional regulator
MSALASIDTEVEWKVSPTGRGGRCSYGRVAGSSVTLVDFTQDVDPLPEGFVWLDDFLEEFETDPALADGLSAARREIAIERMAAGERSLALLRMRQGMSQEQLADAIKTKQSTISRLEAGQQEPRLSMLRRLSAVLKVDMNELEAVFPR